MSKRENMYRVIAFLSCVLIAVWALQESLRVAVGVTAAVAREPTFRHGAQRRGEVTMYPANWPRCVTCGDYAMDGHLTCGQAECDEAAARERQARLV